VSVIGRRLVRSDRLAIEVECMATLVWCARVPTMVTGYRH